MRMGRTVGMTGAVVLALAMTTETCEASFSPVLMGPPTSSGGVFSYNYELQFKAGGSSEKVVTGDFVTIYDFAGFVGPAGDPTSGVTVPANFKASSSFLGLNPMMANPNDSPNALNITLTYTGTPDITTDTNFGPFTIRSTVGPTTTLQGVFSSQNTNTTAGMSKIDSVSTTEVPAGIVPEPSSMILTGLGAIGVLGMLRFRKTSS